MTVSTTAVSVSYAGDGGTTAFPITFQFGTSADLSVVLVNDSTGAETAQSLTTHYTVSQSASGTGTLTMLTAPASGYTLRIRRITAKTQPDSLRNRGQYYPEMVEGMVNRTVRQIQEVGDEASRAIRLPIGSTASGQMTAPVPGALIGWNTDGDGIEQYPADSFSASLAAGITFQYAVSASATTLDVSDIPSPWVPQALFYNGVYQDLSAWGYASGQITFTEALPASGTVSVIATFTGPGQLNESEKVAFTRQATGAISRTLRAKLSDTVSVKDFGAVGDGTTDDTAAILAAIASLGSRGGRVKFPPGDYLYSEEIILSVAGLTLSGAGRSGHFGTGSPGGGSAGGATRLIAAHTTGAAIRIKASDCSVEGLTVDAGTDRAAADLGDNHGIHIEADDTSGASTKRACLRQVRVTNQPAHGIVFVNDVVASRAEMTGVDNCGGHGFLVTGGSFSSRTNKTRPGQVQLDNCWASRTGGHGLLIGGLGESTTDDVPYRVEARNFEAFYNASDVGVRLGQYGIYLSGENLNVEMSASDGRDTSNDDVNSTFYVQGRNITIRNHRCIDGNPYAGYVGNHPLISTRDVLIERPYVQNVNQAPGFYNPAFYIDSSCGHVTVTAGTPGSIVSTLASTGSTGYYIYTGSEEQTNRKRRTRASLLSGLSSTDANLSIADDAAKSITLSAVAHGLLLIAGSTSARGSAVVAFRCGDGSAHATVLSSGGTVAGTTGALTGTTGADGALTISASTTENKLFIENRTGGTGNYHYTFISLNSVTASDAVAV